MSAPASLRKAGRLLDALGDPTRRAILYKTSKKAASVSELAKSLDVTLTAVGQHVTILEGCGLLQTRKVGRVRVCSFDTKGLSVLEEWINMHRAMWALRLDRLGELLADDDG